MSDNCTSGIGQPALTDKTAIAPDTRQYIGDWGLGIGNGLATGNWELGIGIGIGIGACKTIVMLQPIGYNIDVVEGKLDNTVIQIHI